MTTEITLTAEQKRIIESALVQRAGAVMQAQARTEDAGYRAMAQIQIDAILATIKAVKA